MRQRKRFLLMSLLMGAGMVQADMLDVSLVNSDLTGSPGSTVEFFGTISNPSTTDTVYLNGDSWTTGSPFLTLDDTPFFTNAPFFLNPSGNTGPSPLELFDVIIDPSATPGSYNGNLFSILGGPDGGTFTDFGDLVDVPFSVTVQSPTTTTPEPDTFWVVLLASITLAIARRRQSGRPRRANFSA